MAPAPLRFGLIGTGRIGQVHAAGIAADPNAVLTWVADPFVDGARRVSAAFGGAATDSADEVFASGEVDAILVASPTATHVDLIARAVEAGLPVLCEKPIDLDIARVDALRPTIAESGVPVAIGFNRRFDPAFASVRARVAKGEIGALEQLTIVSRDPSAPSSAYVAVSGGIFRDMSIHDFDMARFFLPDIVEVSAVGTTMFDEGAREHGDFDTAVTTLRSASGAIVTIINSRHSAVGYTSASRPSAAKGRCRSPTRPRVWSACRQRPRSRPNRHTRRSSWSDTHWRTRWSCESSSSWRAVRPRPVRRSKTAERLWSSPTRRSPRSRTTPPLPST